MRIAILGGTFNPHHFGHMFLANEVRRKLFYDKILFIPSNIPPHKKVNIENTHRLKMLELITNNYPWAEVCECDMNRGGITRTIDTLNDVYKLYKPEGKLGFIIGDDLAPGFSNWKNPDEIVEICDLIIALRCKNSLENFKYEYLSISNKEFPLSSSEIRERVFLGHDIDFLLPKNVVDYIKLNELYKDN